MIDAAVLPDDVAALRRIIVAQSAELAAATAGLVSKTRPGEVGVFVDPNPGRDRGQAWLPAHRYGAASATAELLPGMRLTLASNKEF